MPDPDFIFPEGFVKKSWKWMISEEELKELEELNEKELEDSFLKKKLGKEDEKEE